MGHAELRRGRYSVAGQIYLITFTTAGRDPHFASWPVASAACRAMTAKSQWQRSRLLAWVLMPEHWHGLIEVGGFDALPACVGRLKGRTARLVRQAHPGIGTVWAPAYHDRALRAEEQLVDVARYLVVNPVRAGLVRRVGDYPYWDAMWL